MCDSNIKSRKCGSHEHQQLQTTQLIILVGINWQNVKNFDLINHKQQHQKNVPQRAIDSSSEMRHKQPQELWNDRPKWSKKSHNWLKMTASVWLRSRSAVVSSLRTSEPKKWLIYADLYLNGFSFLNLKRAGDDRSHQTEPSSVRNDAEDVSSGKILQQSILDATSSTERTTL